MNDQIDVSVRVSAVVRLKKDIQLTSRNKFHSNKKYSKKRSGSQNRKQQSNRTHQKSYRSLNRRKNKDSSKLPAILTRKNKIQSQKMTPLLNSKMKTYSKGFFSKKSSKNDRTSNYVNYLNTQGLTLDEINWKLMAPSPKIEIPIQQNKLFVLKPFKNYEANYDHTFHNFLNCKYSKLYNL